MEKACKQESLNVHFSLSVFNNLSAYLTEFTVLWRTCFFVFLQEITVFRKADKVRKSVRNASAKFGSQDVAGHVQSPSSDHTDASSPRYEHNYIADWMGVGAGHQPTFLRPVPPNFSYRTCTYLLFESTSPKCFKRFDSKVWPPNLSVTCCIEAHFWFKCSVFLTLFWLGRQDVESIVFINV